MPKHAASPLSALAARAERCEQAQRTAAAEEEAAVRSLSAAEAELAQARKSNGVLETLAANLHGRQSTLLKERQETLEREERQQLDEKFREISEVQTKLETVGTARAAQLVESDAQQEAVKTFTEQHAAAEAMHTAAMATLEARHSALQV